MFHPQVLGYQF